MGYTGGFTRNREFYRVVEKGGGLLVVLLVIID